MHLPEPETLAVKYYQLNDYFLFFQPSIYPIRIRKRIKIASVLLYEKDRLVGTRNSKNYKKHTAMHRYIKIN